MSNWNCNFTALLRKDRPTLWGNWSLDVNIVPGAVGIVDLKNGDFTLLNEMIPGSKLVDRPVSQQWTVKSDKITEKQSNVGFDGSVTDPETGLKITAGIKVSWGFTEAGSLSSSFATTREASLDDFTELMQNQFSWLKETARKANMTTDDGITQGFCVVTDVIYAKSGLNVGAQSKSSNFSISGSASGVNEMLGNSLSGNGSYVEKSESSSMDIHMWPSESNSLAVGDVPIAFKVASFDGTFIIPNWTGLVHSLELYLDNRNGGTYIAHGSLTYKVNGKTVSARTNKASGGMRSAISDIPINATDLKYDVTFTASGTKKTFKWGNPINQWVTTYIRHIDVKGVWPGPPSAKDREA